MGNCLLNGYNNNSTSKVLDHNHQHHQLFHDQSEHMMIKVVTSNGGIMELYSPITVDQITSEFPGHGLFQGPDPAHSGPLLHKDQLHPGHLYYLLPLSSSTATTAAVTAVKLATPYRMSVDSPRVMFKKYDPDVVPRYSGTGVWKVRLVINPEQLSDILSQDAKTEELIESVRTVAKCGSGGKTTSSAPSTVSDQSSVSSSNLNFQSKLNLW